MRRRKVCRIWFRGGLGVRLCAVVSEDAEEGFAVGGVAEGFFGGDDAALDELGEGGGHGGHAMGGAGLDEGEELAFLAIADEGADGGGGDHDFGAEGAAGVVGPGDEALGEDDLEVGCEAFAGLGLLDGVEGGDDAGNGLDGAGGVEGGEGEVAGLGEGEGGIHAFAVAHFAEENDVGVFAEGGTEGVVKAEGVVADFALGDEATGGLVDVFDGVFDGGG